MWWRFRTRRNTARRRPTDASRAHYEKHRARARTVIMRRARELAIECAVTYNRIAIRNTCTRWGSCSSRGNLNFHYGLLFLPPRVRDYVIIHELCHLREMNHSPAFWSLVAHHMPDYQVQRDALRAYAPEQIAQM